MKAVPLAGLMAVLPAAGQEGVAWSDDAVPLSEGPMMLETDGVAIEPVDDGMAALTVEGATEVAEITAAAAPPVPKSVRLHATGGVVHDDNIFQTAADAESDTLILLAAGITWTPRLTERNFLSLGYTATAFEYLDHSDLGGDINHDVDLRGRSHWGAATLSAHFGYRRLAGTDVTLSAGPVSATPSLNPSAEERALSPQLNRDLLAAGFGFSRPIAGKTSLNAGVRYQANLYDDLPSTDDLNGHLGLGYLVGARTTLGLKGVIGRTGGDDGALEETYQQALFTAGYDPTEKLDFSGSAGVDFRQADVTAGDDRTDFVFGLSARYQWRERTGLYLNAARSTRSASTLAGAANTTTSFYFGINQKIGERWTLDLAGGYDFEEYQNPTAGYSNLREEDFTIGRATLNFQPAANWFLGSFYEYRHNDSSDETFSYEGNRFGLQLAVSF